MTSKGLEKVGLAGCEEEVGDKRENAFAPIKVVLDTVKKAEDSDAVARERFRGVPFVLTHQATGQANNRLEQAIYSRAAAIIDDCDPDGRRCLRIYKRAVASWPASNALL